MASEPAYPNFDDALSEWTLVEESVETLFQLPSMKVRGATRRYEDERVRTAVREATDGDVDHEWRFVAATKLGFQPSLPPGTLPSMILPSVRSEAKRNFKDRLEERGVRDVERGTRERMRVRSGNRARLTRYDGVDPTGDVAVSGWVGAWNDGRDFFVVTGGYPAEPLGEALGVTGDGVLGMPPNQARDELLDLFRDVS